MVASSFFSFPLADGKLTLSLAPYVLHLRTAFGTSHSSTTIRTNATISVSLETNNSQQSYSGIGEIGLPPKKKLCYLADYNDILNYFEQFCTILQTKWKQYESLSLSHEDFCSNFFSQEDCDFYSPFSSFPSTYFAPLRHENKESKITLQQALPTLLFKFLDSIPIYEETTEATSSSPKLVEYHRTAKCGFEMAIFDFWGKLLSLPLYQMIGVPKLQSKYGFYTAALNEDIKEIEKSYLFGLEYTPFLKIKLDANVEKGIEIMKRLYAIAETKCAEYDHYRWSVDANSAWTPEVTQQYLQKMKQELPADLLRRIYMIEQPFPVDVLYTGEAEQLQKWKEIKQQCEQFGSTIFADESVCSEEDVEKLKDYVHGVNIKLEKAGGVRGALRAVLKAKQLDLKVWLGMMVASTLSATCSAHLLELSDIGGDLDGGLLESKEHQTYKDGFEWVSAAKVQISKMPSSAFGQVLLSNESAPGLGVNIK